MSKRPDTTADADHTGRDGADPAPDYLAPYVRAVADHGARFEATLWANKDMQLDRFRIMCDLVDLEGAAIFDAGTGLGDFATYLHEHGVAYASFLGSEALAPMVEAARERRIPRARFEVSDFAADPGVFQRATPDVVTFSGSLNTMTAAEAMPILDRAWAAAARAVVFNFLSAKNHVRHPVDPSPAKRWEPLELIDFALSRTPRVLFRQDYFNGHDATIAMLR